MKNARSLEAVNTHTITLNNGVLICHVQNIKQSNA